MSQENISVVHLLPQNKGQIIDLVQHRQSFAKSKDSWCSKKYISLFINRLSYYLSPSVFPVLFGAFYKQELLSFMGLHKWEDLPYATLTYHLIRPGAIFFDGSANGTRLLFERVVHYGSQNGIQVFYSQLRFTNPKFFARIKWTLPKKYFSWTEAVIPAHTRPELAVYWDMMDHIIKPYSICIKKTMLKPQYLNDLDWPED